VNASQEGRVPVMLFDGDCGFCSRWIQRWSRLTRGRVRYEPYQRVLAAFPQVSEAQCREAVQLILPDGGTSSGARAVVEALEAAQRFPWLLWSYRHLPLVGLAAEKAYRLVASHRSHLSKLSRSPRCDQ